MIPALKPPDSLHLQDAPGWLALANHVEANEELEKITPSLRAHPAVLEFRCQVYAAAKKWEYALDIATALTKLEPENPTEYIQRSSSLRRLNRTAEARDNLASVVDKFPSNAMMRYDLACYECQIGRL